MRAFSVGPALLTLLLILAPPASAQYMYLDSNGDGISTAADRLNGSGVTRVDVWLDTAHDRNGASVSCNSHTGMPSDNQPLDLFEYSITLEAVGAGASVTWGTFADSLVYFYPLGTDLATPTATFFERVAPPSPSSPPKPQGLYKLGSIDVTVASGSPTIRISPGIPLPSYSSSYTLFGSHCPATNNPNSYTLGLDWFDADGLGAPTTVTAPLAARVFSATNSGGTFRLHSGKPNLCLQIEPVDADYENTNVDLNTLTLLSIGTGTVGQIAAIGDKTPVLADRDRNGVREVTACFARSDLENLFGQVNGRKDVPVTLEGRLISGGTFSGTTTLTVVGNRSSLHASISPNPFNPQATLRFVIDRSGPLRVRVYDIGGRMIRELANESSAPAGEHLIRIDGRAGGTVPMPSGIYLYRIETAEETVTGRFAILK